VRFVCRRRVPDAGPLHRADPHARRQLGPRLAERLAARPEPSTSCTKVVRFFDRWLKGEANGLDAEPPVVWFERDAADPEPFPEAWPGRWRAADAYPHPATLIRPFLFEGGTAPLAGRLVERGPVAPGVDEYRHRPTVGTRGSLSWGAGGIPNGLARDLRPDEALGPTFTSAGLIEPLSILGEPVVVLHLAVDLPVATAVVRLADVAPDGTSSWVSAGILNLTHRRSDTDPEPLVAGELIEVRVPLRHAGYRFEPGHRIRVSVASSAWPVIWPSPYPATFALHRGDATPSRIELPVIPAAGGPTDRPVPAFKTTPPDLRDVGGGGASDAPQWRIEEDVIAGAVTVTIHDGGGDVLEDGRRLYAAETLRLTASDRDPAAATLDADVVYRWAETGHAIEIRARSRQTSDVAAFDITVDLAVDLDGVRFFDPLVAGADPAPAGLTALSSPSGSCRRPRRGPPRSRSPGSPARGTRPGARRSRGRKARPGSPISTRVPRPAATRSHASIRAAIVSS